MKPLHRNMNLSSLLVGSERNCMEYQCKVILKSVKALTTQVQPCIMYFHNTALSARSDLTRNETVTSHSLR